MGTLSFYLAGSIQKGHEDNASEWTTAHIDELKTRLKSYHLCFLNPAHRSDDLTDEKSVFGRDMTQVYLADIVLVDARHRRGLGVGAEMMWAKLHHKPVLIWAPEDTHYRKKNSTLLGKSIAEYTHPFVHSLGDYLFSTLEELASWIEKYAQGEIQHIKDLSSIQEAMAHYRTAQYPKDEPMQALLETCDRLSKKFQAC